MCNIQEDFKVHYPKLTVMRGVEHTVSLFFNYVSKIPILNQMIYVHKIIYNIFGSGIYHKPRSIFKSKSQEFHNITIGIFSGNDTIMDEYFVGMHIDLRMWKVLQATTSSAEFISIPTNNKYYKAFRYIHDKPQNLFFTGPATLACHQLLDSDRILDFARK